MSAAAPAAHNSVGKTVRRLIVFVLLFILVIIASNGLAGLLARVVDSGALLTEGDTTGLATSLAFTLIAGPLAAVLWWFTWRGLSESVERGSVLWGLYLAAMSTVALILGVWSLLTTLSNLVSGHWDGQAFSTGVVWAAVWLWHWWMAHHRSKSPTRLAAATRILGYAFGIVVGAVATVQFFSALFDLAVAPSTNASSVGAPWWTTIAQSAVWALGGAFVWWLHWILDKGAQLRTGFATVMLVLVAGLAAVGLALVGIATAIYVGLRLAFERGVPMAELVDPLGAALGAASVGAILWAYYRLQVRGASSAARRGVRLVSAGVALAAAATGVGIVINSILAAVVTPLVESDSRSLLFAGLSVLVVGGPAWWLIWKPLSPVTADDARDTGRRVYLITVFGISALVAIITLLVIGFQIFDFALSGSAGGVLLDRVRASLGLLIATALVGVYHFSVWRRDRAQVPAEGSRPQTIGRVVLVAGADHEAAVRAIREATGAAVTVWTRSDEQVTAVPAKLAAALDGVTGSRVLVIAGAKVVQVIPLDG